MKLYRTTTGNIIEYNHLFYHAGEQHWDKFVNDDDLLKKCYNIVHAEKVDLTDEINEKTILPPLLSQELWACGVTYLRSKEGRQEEAKEAGGGDFYARVYEAERPEVFFKSTPHRVVGHNGIVRIRKDSSWNVPEPELTLVVTSSGKIVGYTIGNDMSSRSIEGENPLYLPQAKTYDGCASVGPCVYMTDDLFPPDAMIRLEIRRNIETVFEGSIAINQMKRRAKELVSFVYRECSFPHGALIMTGTGIVPGVEFTLHPGDEISISIDNIGMLVNTVK